MSLSAVFGAAAVDIAQRVKDFDWSKINVRDQKSSDYLHEGLAPSYGSLTSESMRQLDDELKVMIVGTLKSLAKLPPSQRTAENVESVMMNNTLLEPWGEKTERADKLIKSGTNFFKFDGSPDSAVVQEVLTWWHNLIKDEDVLRSTKIDAGVMARIVAQSGATIDSFETFWVKTETHEQTMIDIGVLRFPDPDQPYFKLYRIKLRAWSDCTRIIFYQEDRNGITGEFYSRKFRPRASVIRQLKQEIIDKAVEEAEALLG